MQCLEATKERFSMRSKKLLHKSSFAFLVPGYFMVQPLVVGYAKHYSFNSQVLQFKSLKKKLLNF